MKTRSGLCLETHKRTSSILGTKDMTFDKSRLGTNSLLALARDPWLTDKYVTSKGILIKLLLVVEKKLVVGFFRSFLWDTIVGMFILMV